MNPLSSRDCLFSVRLFVVACLAIALMSPALQAAPNEVKISELAPGVFFRKAQTEPKFTPDPATESIPGIFPDRRAGRTADCADYFLRKNGL